MNDKRLPWHVRLVCGLLLRLAGWGFVLVAWAKEKISFR